MPSGWYQFLMAKNGTKRLTYLDNFQSKVGIRSIYVDGVTRQKDKSFSYQILIFSFNEIQVLILIYFPDMHN